MAASVKVSDVGCPKCQAAPGDSCYGDGRVAIGGMATIGGGPAYHWARRGVLYGVEVFENEDDRYLAWLTMNPYGFVLDCSLSSDPNSRLHRVSCRSIPTRPLNGKPEKWPWLWTGRHTKVCSLSKQALERWVMRDRRGRQPVLCQRCNPS